MNKKDLFLSLEHDARCIMRYSERPTNTIFDADNIECGHFYEVMVILLREKSNFSMNSKIDEFVKKHMEYCGENGQLFDINMLNSVYDEFKKILESI